MWSLAEQSKHAETTKQQFPAGCKVRVNFVADGGYEYAQGATGTVQYVDDASQVHIALDNGRSVTVCKGYGDSFSKI